MKMTNALSFLPALSWLSFSNFSRSLTVSSLTFDSLIQTWI
jgi:hypothetical protein